MAIYRKKSSKGIFAKLQPIKIKMDPCWSYIRIEVLEPDGTLHTIALDPKEQAQLLAVRRRIKKKQHKSATQQKLNSKKMPGTK